jgi:hypothetical protein
MEFPGKKIENFDRMQQTPTPQYNKKYRVNIGSLKSGFRFTAS